MFLSRRNCAAAVRRKSSGDKRLVSEWNKESIHFDNTKSLVHTYLKIDIQLFDKIRTDHWNKQQDDKSHIISTSK